MPTFNDPETLETEQAIINPITSEDGHDIHVAVLENMPRLSEDFPGIISRYGTSELQAVAVATAASYATASTSNPLEAYTVREKESNRFLGIATLALLNRKSSMVLGFRPRFSDLIAGWSVEDTPDEAMDEVATTLLQRSAKRMSPRLLGVAYVPDLVTVIRPDNFPAESLATQMGMVPKKVVRPRLLHLAGIDDGVTQPRRLWTMSNPHQLYKH